MIIITKQSAGDVYGAIPGKM